MGGGAQTHSTVPAPQLAAALLHKCTTSLDFSYLLLLLLLLLAEMCTEAPWNDPEAWRYVDLRFNDGRVYTIFFSLVMKMGGDEETLKDFRRKC